MSAQGDLRNALRREARRRRRDRVAVELSRDTGKYLSREDDPSLPLRIAEAEAEAREAVPASVREGLSEAEGRVWELMQCGERRTEVYAAALGITHLPWEEQRREVKRVKDRLTKRCERAEGGHA
jgi:hypothetical protein